MSLLRKGVLRKDRGIPFVCICSLDACVRGLCFLYGTQR